MEDFKEEVTPADQLQEMTIVISVEKLVILLGIAQCIRKNRRSMEEVDQIKKSRRIGFQIKSEGEQLLIMLWNKL